MFRPSNRGRGCYLRSARRLLHTLVIGIHTLLAPLSTPAHAQEAIRSSLASEEAMDAKKRAATAGQYNVKFANLALELGTRLGIELNDNIYYTEQGQTADIIFRPQLTATAVWLLTEQNRLNLSLGVGYAKYVNNPILDIPFMTPGSDLSFDVYVRDFVINFHDRFSLQQDVSAQLTFQTNVAYINRFENTAGVQASWDLNHAVVSAGYDHYNFVSLTSDYDYLTRQSELFFGRAMFEFNPVTWAGVELGGGMTTYKTNTLNNVNHLSGGGVLTYRSSQYLSLRLGAGYVTYVSDDSSANVASDTSGPYLNLLVNHQLNPKISYSLSIGHEITAGWTAETLELYYFRGRVGWNVIRRGSLGTSLSYEHGTEELNTSSGIYDRYGAGIDLTRSFSTKLSANLSYWFYYQTSPDLFTEYTQNRLVLELRYRF